MKAIHSYRDPVDFPIPEGTDPVECLNVTLKRADGLFTMLQEGKNDYTTAATIDAGVGLVRQAHCLVDFWQKEDQKTKAVLRSSVVFKLSTIIKFLEEVYAGFPMEGDRCISEIIENLRKDPQFEAWENRQNRQENSTKNKTGAAL